MPNWCNGVVKVTGKPENVRKFCRLFNFEENVSKGDKRTGKYFARSFVYQKWKDFRKTISHSVEFSVDFAWSCWSCLIEGYPQKSDGECVTLKKACKKYQVEVKITTEEIGLGFEEEITCDEEGDLKYDSKDMLEYKCKGCGRKQCIPSSYNQKERDEQTCWNCDKEAGWY